jgi:hypothetical protein
MSTGSRGSARRYLGAIPEGRLACPLSADRFCRRVYAALAEPPIGGGQRHAIEATPAAKVPRPDPTVVKRRRRARAAEQAILMRAMGRLATVTVGVGGQRRLPSHPRPSGSPSGPRTVATWASSSGHPPSPKPLGRSGFAGRGILVSHGAVPSWTPSSFV